MNEPEVRAFLSTRFPDLAGGLIEIRAKLLDGDGRMHSTFHTTLDDAVRTVCSFTGRVNVYYGVNLRVTTKGNGESVRQVNALWADIDAKDFGGSKAAARAAIDAFPLPPSLIIDSGNGFHCYWFLTTTVTLVTGIQRQSLTRLVKRLSQALGGDKVHDLARVLRVPGTTNYNYSMEPAVRIVLSEPGRRYTLQQLDLALPPDERPAVPQFERQTPTDLTIDETLVAELLRAIPPDCSYDEWLKILMAVHALFPGDQGIDLIEAWSPGYQGEVASKFRSFKRHGVTISSLFYVARQYGWQPPQRGTGPTFTVRHREDPPHQNAHEWRWRLAETAPVERDELPFALHLLWRHLEPLALPFPGDWLNSLTLTAWSTFFPQVRLENLNLALWFLGVSSSGSAKNITSDEAVQIVSRLNHDLGADTEIYTGGSPEGLQRLLHGDGKKVLSYHGEYAGYLANLSSDFNVNAKATLCNIYDGRIISHQLARESIKATNPYSVTIATTTAGAIRRYAQFEDLKSGYLSRFYTCAVNARSVDVIPNISAYDRACLTRDLLRHLSLVSNVTSAHWDTAHGEIPSVLTDYARRLGIGAGEEIDLDDDLYSTDMPRGRDIVRVKKLAALLELAEALPVIDADGVLVIRQRNIELAIRLVERHIAYQMRLVRFIAGSKDEALTDHIERTLTRNGPMSVRNLCRFVHEPAKDVRLAIELLLDSGAIVEHANTLSGRSKTYRLIPEREREELRLE